MDNFIYSFFDFKLTSFLLNFSVCTALSVIIISLFRPVFGKKFRGSWRYALWIILPLCFLLPVRFRSSFSFIPIFDYFEYIPMKITSPPLRFTGIDDAGGYLSDPGDPVIVSFGDYFIWIWLIVFLILIAYQLIKLYLLDRRVKRRGTVCENDSYLEILSGVCREIKVPVPRLIIFPEADTPFAMGIIKPEIILPRQDYTDEELGFIFRHETVHIKRKDIFLKLIMIIFRSANWFNPFAYLMCRKAFEDIEITCDERAAEGLSEEERSRYSAAILQGVSRGKYPAVTTYLSSNARTLKKRISAVMTLKKLGGAVPFAVVFAAVMLCTLTVYSVPGDSSGGFYVCMDPYAIEETPYNVKSEWRTCEADNSEEAGRKIFAQYMDMYMGEDVPEYYRIENYSLVSITALSNDPKGILKAWSSGTPIAFADNKEYCSLAYNIEYTNKCGNTAHHIYYKGFPQYFNGYNCWVFMNFEMEKHGRTYTLTNIGTYCASVVGSVHFRNAQDETLEYLGYMARCGLLDCDWDVKNDLPDPVQINAVHYLYEKNHDPETDAVYTNQYDLLGARFYGDYLSGAYNADENGNVVIDGSEFTDGDFEFCGIDFNCETLEMKAYGNVLGAKPHGVIVTFEETDGYKSFRFNALSSVAVTDELFTPVVYHDSFDSIPLPEKLAENRTVEGAGDIMEYMKTPRDGCDFTVLDYRNITMEDGEIYAEVNFKGRLEGVYSSDLKKWDKKTHEPVSDGYIRVRIV